MWLGKFIRDPLSHFLAIGLVLLALSFLLKGTTEDTSKIIHLSAGDLEGVNRVWTKTHLEHRNAPKLPGFDSRHKESIQGEEAG